MLDFLGKSKIRKKIILLFVYNRGKEFYLSEIARRVKTSVGTAQRELNRLLAQDFITFRKKGNLNIYRLNETYSLLNEIESIIRKTFGIEAELGNELRKVRGVLFGFLYGSYAKASLRSDSDIEAFQGALRNSGDGPIFLVLYFCAEKHWQGKTELSQFFVDCPRGIYEGTLKRFENWHRRQINVKRKKFTKVSD
jgi:predicted transcriptional regulator with HTH domain